MSRIEHEVKRPRIQVTALEGVSGYSLSKMVAEINDVEKVDKAVLRALADHYPNIWPSVETVASEAGWGTTASREAFRKLEKAGWIKACGDKRGGMGNSEQYLINVPKIAKAWKENNPPSVVLEPNGSCCDNPTSPEQNPTPRERKATPAVGEDTSKRSGRDHTTNQRLVGDLSKTPGKARKSIRNIDEAVEL